MTHDPLCPFVSSKAEIFWRPKCPNCVLIARVRENERTAALRDAVKAVKALPDGKWLADAYGVMSAIEALGGEQ